MSKPSIQDLKSCNELIFDLITLRLVLKDTEKTKIGLKLEIKNKLKELEQEKINELKLLEEEIIFMTLRNKHLGRSSHITKEEEIELREQTKKKVDKIEELKEGIDGIEFQSFKTLEDLIFLKHEEKTEQKLIRFGILKEVINFYKKLIIPKKYLHLVSKEQLENTLIISSRYIYLRMLLLYFVRICIFLKLFVDDVYFDKQK